MASISEQRLKEMEAEMNRFEQEIAPSPNDEPQGTSGMIISSGTFDQVQAQLRQLRQESSGVKTDQPLVPPPPPPASGTVSQSFNQQTLGATSGIDLSSALAPPPPPPPEPGQDQSQYSSEAPPMMAPPPPPPPILAPAFVPPQLRHRPPMNPHMTHMDHHRPHGMPGHGHMMPVPFSHQHPMLRPQHMVQPMDFPRGPYHQPGYHMMGGGDGSNMGGPGYPMDGQQNNSATIEAKSKIIYSAPPVKNISKGSESSTPAASKKGGKSDRKEKPGDSGVFGPAAYPDGSTSNMYDEGAPGAGMQSSEDITVADMEIDADVSMPTRRERKEKKKKFVRLAAGTTWEDPTLAEWDQDDFRMFCGDLGNEVTDEVLTRAFGKYPTFQKAKVIRDRRTNKTKGFGFVSFKDPADFTRAMREMNGADAKSSHDEFPVGVIISHFGI
ncbi:hypothetical protein C0Q70_12776 [Pomacea canaliculata]|uniref:RNA-binding protein 42 n=1 Tax=Pomacea canaliculata TaxID=400727 RepID=A0A2T7P2G0_POMCA|nr:hypothetical protein C0Q70_12776 [Pomacea canaliculata]